ncbi:MAG: sigma-70 family RNA polymerase sigma factor [Sedimentisphaerales bacterium]|nr:sigma-70 family RNA polymerase sigma factor [Sedimentisphaerales bacterium]
MHEPEPKTFVAKLVKMDSHAWRTFCCEYAPALVAYAKIHFGCSSDNAEEIAQRTFVRSVRSIRRFDPGRGTLADWLRGICRNEARTLLARDCREIPLSQIAARDLEVLERIDDVPLPEEVMAQREVQGLVNETVFGLYDRYRDVLIRKYLKGEPVATIASESGQSEKAVESLLSRSREAFKTAFLRRVRRLREGGAESL